MTRSGHIRLMQRAYSGLRPAVAVVTALLCPMPYLSVGDFLVVLYPTAWCKFSGWGPHEREMAIPSLLPLSNVWWRYSFSQCLARPSQYTTIRALADADFGRCPPPPVCITHLLPSLPYLSGYVDHLGGRALGSHGAQGLCTVKVRMIYSANIANEKKWWVRPENTMEFTLKSWAELEIMRSKAQANKPPSSKCWIWDCMFLSPSFSVRDVLCSGSAFSPAWRQRKS